MRQFFILFFMTTLFFACGEPCDDVNCGLNGTCDVDSGDCICDAWYEGASCETETRAKFLGVWNSTTNCEFPANPGAEPVWTLAEVPAANQFILQSPDVLGDKIIEVTLTNDNEGTITPFMNNGSEVTGSISYLNATTMTFELFFQDLDLLCTYNMSK